MAFYNEMGPADIQAVTGGGNCNNGWGGGMWGDWDDTAIKMRDVLKAFE